MQTLQIETNNAIAAYKNQDEKGKKLLIDLFGQDVFKLSIFDRLKTFEDAVAILPIDPEMAEIVYYEGKNPTRIKMKHQARVEHAIEVINEGWIGDLNDGNQRKYRPYFKMSSSGLRFHDYVCDFSSTAVGARLWTKDEARCSHIAKHFLSDYEKFYVKSN